MNIRRSRKFGFGWSTEPTGRDAYSIKPPEAPNYTGTIKSIMRSRASDRAYQTYATGNATNYYATRWFWNGKPITHIYRSGRLSKDSDFCMGWFGFREEDIIYCGELIGDEIKIRVD